MNKPTISFHGKSESKERLIERVAARLEARLHGKKAPATFPLLGETPAQIEPQSPADIERLNQITALCKRAKAAADFPAALKILSERVTLTDIDRVYRRSNGEWSRFDYMGGVK